MAQKRLDTNFIDYLKAAKTMVAAVSVPNFEAYFENLKAYDTNIGYSDQVLFVLDFRTAQFIYLSPNIVDFGGYSHEECIRMGPIGYMELYHVIDADLVMNKIFPLGVEFVKTIKDYDQAKLKISYNYRLKQKDGSYKMLLQQFSHLMSDEDLNPLVIMGTTTDISEIHSKPEMFCRMHYKNNKGKWEKIFERFYPLTEKMDEYGLTPKEIEIIKFVHKGLSSKEIANLTQRSEETIKSQRKSILSKTGCQTMTDVVVLATKHDWL
jgi:DNA-binding CsgD family transcriptional regulator